MFFSARSAAILAAATIALASCACAPRQPPDEARPFLDRFIRDAPAAQYAPDIVKVKRVLGR